MENISLICVILDAYSVSNMTFNVFVPIFICSLQSYPAYSNSWNQGRKRIQGDKETAAEVAEAWEAAAAAAHPKDE